MIAALLLMLREPQLVGDFMRSSVSRKLDNSGLNLLLGKRATTSTFAWFEILHFKLICSNDSWTPGIAAKDQLVGSFNPNIALKEGSKFPKKGPPC